MFYVTKLRIGDGLTWQLSRFNVKETENCMHTQSKMEKMEKKKCIIGLHHVKTFYVVNRHRLDHSGSTYVFDAFAYQIIKCPISKNKIRN